MGRTREWRAHAPQLASHLRRRSSRLVPPWESTGAIQMRASTAATRWIARMGDQAGREAVLVLSSKGFWRCERHANPDPAVCVRARVVVQPRRNRRLSSLVRAADLAAWKLRTVADEFRKAIHGQAAVPALWPRGCMATHAGRVPSHG